MANALEVKAAGQQASLLAQQKALEVSWNPSGKAPQIAAPTPSASAKVVAFNKLRGIATPTTVAAPNYNYTLKTGQLLYDPVTAKQFKQGQTINVLGDARYNRGATLIPKGLRTGWAPDLSKISTLSAPTTKKKTNSNPLTASVGGTTKSKNPFFAEAVPSPDSFGLNIPA